MAGQTANFNGAIEMVNCINECGNETHPMVPECGDCMSANGVISTRYNKAFISTRRSFISGY